MGHQVCNPVNGYQPDMPHWKWVSTVWATQSKYFDPGDSLNKEQIVNENAFLAKLFHQQDSMGSCLNAIRRLTIRSRNF